jgi:hypothetical protein
MRAIGLGSITLATPVDNTPLTYEIFDVHSVHRFHEEGQT